ncbi:hypothetical protein HAX54_006878 [Datura stramonium]|uniref:Peptidase M28 domain-containing protein n=1 Tax=Datura stramonium TaxID=4076 RepID=A0ABS8TCA5_DATST|nr:hypothetical protein [Datura stramonium]
MHGLMEQLTPIAEPLPCLAIARRYALLMRLGWSPRRTIILCSWDAEEFGMIGSTEWVEQNLVNLGSKSVAYLNVDCAVQGPGFFPSATPQLDNLLIEITKMLIVFDLLDKVNDPDSEGMALYERWTAANRGVPSVDLYYGRGSASFLAKLSPNPKSSKQWDFSASKRHVAVTGVWGLLALRLAEDPIYLLTILPYAELQDYTIS